MTLLLVCNLNCYFVFVSEVLEEDQQLLLQPTAIFFLQIFLKYDLTISDDVDIIIRRLQYKHP